MTLSEIIRDVALRIGADPGEGMEGVESPYPLLEDRISADVEHFAAEAILSTPRERLTGWRLLPDEGMRIADDGCVTLPLPEDFLMLHSIRMSDWEREVTEVLPAGHWLTRLQGSRWHGLRGSPSRPLAFMGIGESGETVIRLYSSSPAAKVAGGWYLPAPRIDPAGEIEIPPAAYHTVIESLATSLRLC